MLNVFLSWYFLQVSWWQVWHGPGALDISMNTDSNWPGQVRAWRTDTSYQVNGGSVLSFKGLVLTRSQWWRLDQLKRLISWLFHSSFASQYSAPSHYHSPALSHTSIMSRPQPMRMSPGLPSKQLGVTSLGPAPPGSATMKGVKRLKYILWHH